MSNTYSKAEFIVNNDWSVLAKNPMLFLVSRTYLSKFLGEYVATEYCTVMKVFNEADPSGDTDTVIVTPYQIKFTTDISTYSGKYSDTSSENLKAVLQGELEHFMSRVETESDTRPTIDLTNTRLNF